MNYAETDYVLGRVLRMAGRDWRVLRIDVRRNQVWCLPLDGANLRGVWAWDKVQLLIRESRIEVV